MNELNNMELTDLMMLAKNLSINVEIIPTNYDEFTLDYPNITREDFIDYIREILVEAIEEHPPEIIKLNISMI